MTKDSILRPKCDLCVVINGLGRCGTTMLYRAIVGTGLKARPFVPSLDHQDRFAPGTALKTHSRPPSSSLPEHVRVVYLFSNPMDIAVSAHRLINQWSALHHEHLGSNRHVDNDQVLEEDSLCLAAHFEQWYSPKSFHLLAIRYESLWTEPARLALREFLGFSITLPAWRARRSDWTGHSRRAALEAAYGPLATVIDRVPSVSHLGPRA